MDLPEDKGTYVLIVSVTQMKRLEIGRLGTFDVVPGFYAYVGSAFGAGGLRTRMARGGKDEKLLRVPVLHFEIQ